jgi:hypothetical protein
MEERDFFTREVCAVRIDEGVATVTVKSGSMRINIDMRVSTLIKNMAVCTGALARWQREQQGVVPIPIRRRAHAASPSKSS